MTEEKKPWDRTAEDYLAILQADPDTSFGEYDNTTVIFEMIDNGLLELRKDRPSILTTMQTTLWVRLTAASRSSIAEEGKK